MVTFRNLLNQNPRNVRKFVDYTFQELADRLGSFSPWTPWWARTDNPSLPRYETSSGRFSDLWSSLGNRNADPYAIAMKAVDTGRMGNKKLSSAQRLALAQAARVARLGAETGSIRRALRKNLKLPSAEQLEIRDEYARKFKDVLNELRKRNVGVPYFLSSVAANETLHAYPMPQRSLSSPYVQKLLGALEKRVAKAEPNMPVGQMGLYGQKTLTQLMQELKRAAAGVQRNSGVRDRAWNPKDTPLIYRGRKGWFGNESRIAQKAETIGNKSGLAQKSRRSGGEISEVVQNARPEDQPLLVEALDRFPEALRLPWRMSPNPDDLKLFAEAVKDSTDEELKLVTKLAASAHGGAATSTDYYIRLLDSVMAYRDQLTPEAREVAIALAGEWSGTPDELIQTAVELA